MQLPAATAVVVPSSALRVRERGAHQAPGGGAVLPLGLRGAASPSPTSTSPLAQVVWRERLARAEAAAEARRKEGRGARRVEVALSGEVVALASRLESTRSESELVRQAALLEGHTLGAKVAKEARRRVGMAEKAVSPLQSKLEDEVKPQRKKSLVVQDLGPGWAGEETEETPSQAARPSLPDRVKPMAWPSASLQDRSCSCQPEHQVAHLSSEVRDREVELDARRTESRRWSGLTRELGSGLSAARKEQHQLATAAADCKACRAQGFQEGREAQHLAEKLKAVEAELQLARLGCCGLLREEALGLGREVAAGAAGDREGTLAWAGAEEGLKGELQRERERNDRLWKEALRARNAEEAACRELEKGSLELQLLKEAKDRAELGLQEKRRELERLVVVVREMEQAREKAWRVLLKRLWEGGVEGGSESPPPLLLARLPCKEGCSDAVVWERRAGVDSRTLVWQKLLQLNPHLYRASCRSGCVGHSPCDFPGGGGCSIRASPSLSRANITTASTAATTTIPPTTAPPTTTPTSSATPSSPTQHHRDWGTTANDLVKQLRDGYHGRHEDLVMEAEAAAAEWHNRCSSMMWVAYAVGVLAAATTTGRRWWREGLEQGAAAAAEVVARTRCFYRLRVAALEEARSREREQRKRVERWVLEAAKIGHREVEELMERRRRRMEGFLQGSCLGLAGVSEAARAPRGVGDSCCGRWD
ncbi:unnamed protein product [Discosporangium mesarthrocarpum]